MSIYIPGMEMPKERPQLLWIYPDGKVITVKSDVDPEDNFNAVPVPPHGRLIDADDFIKRMEGLVHRAEAEGYDLGAAWYTAFIRHIELAPTVIEAEEGE